MSRFTVVDVETANASMASICQIGVVAFEGGTEVSSTSFLVDPEDWFDPINVSIHGINANHVVGCPAFSELHQQLIQLLDHGIVVCHSHFDRVALSRANHKASLPDFNCRWLDSAKVARRAWQQFSQRGYGLSNLAGHLGLEFRHHDAEEDARTAGLVLLEAMKETGIGLDDWLDVASRPISVPTSISRAGNKNGSLADETIAFTGALSLARADAADLAANAGADVVPGVSKKITILVVGDQDITKLAGKNKSAKHLKAEALMSNGHTLRIIGEQDFLVLCGPAN